MKQSEMQLIVHFGELWLRGKNRGYYINTLKHNIAGQLKGESFVIHDIRDRLVLNLNSKSDVDSIRKKIACVFGISAYEIAYRSKPTLADIIKVSVAAVKESKAKSVRIDAHRAYKGFKFNSYQITSRLLKELPKIKVEPRIEDYEKELSINVTKDCAFIYLDRSRGCGGLPVGTSGRCVILLSGGIDSPVAAWYAMKRGLTPIYVHVHGYSENKEARSSKISSIVKILSRYSPSTKSYYIPSHIFQMSAMKTKRYELVLMKAFMLKIAERIAEKEGAGAIITGESLGQVASQTLSNIHAEEQGIGIPILRPLIGFDKIEITNVAKSIGTYNESTKPYKDVCSINSRSPATASKPDVVKAMSKKIKLDSVVSRSLKLGDSE